MTIFLAEQSLLAEKSLLAERNLRLVAIIFLSALSCWASAAEKADRVLVVKSAKALTLYSGNRILATYHVVFGARPVGHKQKEGDKRTPEGIYTLDFKKSKSPFYKSIHISYPNAHDIETAMERGVSPGGSIMIHGQKKYLGHAYSRPARNFNWTNGCIAMSNEDMDAVWDAVDQGTPIEIRP